MTVTNVLQYVLKSIRMKEVKLIKMRHDINVLQQMVYILLDRVEKLEKEQKKDKKVDDV